MRIARLPSSFCLVGLLFSLSPLILPGTVQAQPAAAQKTPGPLTTQAVADNLYMITGEGGNVAVYVTDDGVILVDNMFDRNHDGILAEVAKLTDQPIRFALNTHQHDDHAGGDHKLLPIADVIAHDNVRANLSDIKQPYYEDTPGTPIGLPNITFADGMSLFPGGHEVQIRYFGRGHTNGDAVVYFPALKVIHTGDLFLHFPGRNEPGKPRGANIYVDYAQGGSFLEWTRTLDRILELDFDTVIPGHGTIATKADVVQFRADVAAMRERVAGMIRDGAGKAAVAKTFEDDYGWRYTGCPPTPPTPGCLQFQQLDALIRELR